MEGRIWTNTATLINCQGPMYDRLEAALESVFGGRMGPFSLLNTGNSVTATFETTNSRGTTELMEPVFRDASRGGRVRIEPARRP